jgi:hypothetical protein
MNQLANALARSSLRDRDDTKHENGKRLTKNQRKKQKSRQARKRAHAQGPDSVGVIQPGSQNQQSTARETRSMTGMLPLPFDKVYLSGVGDQTSFMTNDQIMDWIKSAFDPHIKDWYYECLSAPENQSRVEAVRDAPYVFAEAVVEEAMDQHSSSELLGSLLGETDACPTAFRLQKRRANNLTFIQHSAMVACLVVRDGKLSHPFSINACRRRRHHAAAMLLTSVITDLKTNFGYFQRLLLRAGKDDKKNATEREQQCAESQASFKEIDCTEEVGQGLLKILADSSTVSAEVDLLSVQARGLSIQ